MTGTVFQANGKPAPAAKVFASNYFFDWQIDRKEATTDHQGRYCLDLSHGIWFVFAVHGSEGGDGVGQQLTKEIWVDENRYPDPIDIYLEDRASLKVRLLAEESNQPILGAKVVMETGMILTTNSAGVAETGGLATGSHFLGVVAAGRMTKRFSFTAGGSQTAYLELKVPKGGTVRGQVKDQNGKPVAGVRVSHWLLWRSHGAILNTAITGANGEYELDAFAPPECKANVFTLTPSGQFHESREFICKQNNQEVDLLLESGTTFPPEESTSTQIQSLRGKVLDAQARPIKGALITWWNRNANRNQGPMQNRTNELGEFQLTVPQEDGEVAVHAKGFVPFFAKTPAGEDQSVLWKLSSGKTIAGKVIDDLGEPISGAWIAPRARRQWSHEPFKELATRTDAQGRFELSGLDESMEFRLIHTGLGRMDGQLSQNGAMVNPIVFARPGIIRGRLSDPKNRSVRNFRIDFSEAKKETRNSQKRNTEYFYVNSRDVHFTSDDGFFTLTGLNAGKEYALAAKVPGFGDGVIGSVSARPLGQKETSETAQLQLTSPHEWKIKVVERDGRPVTGASLRLIRDHFAAPKQFHWNLMVGLDHDQQFCLTDEEGVAQFTAIGQPQGTLLIQAPGFARKRLAWNREMTKTTVVLQSEAILEGELICDPFWYKTRRYDIELTLSNGEMVRLAGSSDGKFRFEGLPPGKSSIYVQFGLSSRNALDYDHFDLKEGRNPCAKIDR